MMLLQLLFLAALINVCTGDPVSLPLYTESTNELVVDNGIARTSSKNWKVILKVKKQTRIGFLKLHKFQHSC